MFGGGGIVMGVKANVQCLLAPGCSGVVEPLKLLELFKLPGDANDRLVNEVGETDVVVAVDKREIPPAVMGGVTVTMALVVFVITFVAAV